jgi:hypothetical protein
VDDGVNVGAGADNRRLGGTKLHGGVGEGVRRYDMWSCGCVQPWRAALRGRARGRRGMVVGIGFNDVGRGRKCTLSGREAHPRKCGTHRSVGWCGLGWCGLGGHSKYVGQLVDGVHLSITNGGEWGCRYRVVDGPAEVNDCTNGGIGGGELRHFSAMWKKLHSAGDASGSGFGGIYSVAPVVFRGSFIDTMDRPSVATVWCFVDEELRAGKREGRSIVIECSVELSFMGESWIYAGWSHQV